MTRDLYRARFFLDNKIFLLEMIERCSIVFERIDRFFVSMERVQAVALASAKRRRRRSTSTTKDGGDREHEGSKGGGRRSSDGCQQCGRGVGRDVKRGGLSEGEKRRDLEGKGERKMRGK